jgi:hypothetical protein
MGSAASAAEQDCDGSYRIVPKPADRLALVPSSGMNPEQCGHFGVRRTAALLHGKLVAWLACRLCEQCHY